MTFAVPTENPTLSPITHHTSLVTMLPYAHRYCQKIDVDSKTGRMVEWAVNFRFGPNYIFTCLSAAGKQMEESGYDI